jgi:hypothetical protein
MTHGPHDESPDSMDMTEDTGDPALDALLRRAAGGAPRVAFADLESRIRSAAAFPLAARRRNARSSMADNLAAWVRVALPLAAAAALFAAFSFSRVESTTLADAELSESDPGALLSALESGRSIGLARRVISSDAASSVGYDLENR